MRLADIAPRLAKARDALSRHRLEAALARREARIKLTEAERVLAHRELQAVRAAHTGSRSYMARRDRKLKASKVAVDYWRTQLARREAA